MKERKKKKGRPKENERQTEDTQKGKTKSLENRERAKESESWKMVRNKIVIVLFVSVRDSVLNKSQSSERGKYFDLGTCVDS